MADPRPRYIVMRGKDIDTFQRSVSYKLGEGYECARGVSTYYTAVSKLITYSQAMQLSEKARATEVL